MKPAGIAVGQPQAIPRLVVEGQIGHGRGGPGQLALFFGISGLRT